MTLLLTTPITPRLNDKWKTPLFRCSHCGAMDGLVTYNYLDFECLLCGWSLTLIDALDEGERKRLGIEEKDDANN